MKTRMLIRRPSLLLLCVLLLLSAVGCGGSAVTSQVSDTRPSMFPSKAFPASPDMPFGEEQTTTTTSVTKGTTTGRTEHSTVSQTDKAPTGTTTQPYTCLCYRGEDMFANLPARLKGKTIQFVNWGESNDPEYRKVIEAFTAKTGIKVEGTVYNETEYATRVAASIASGSTIDVIACKNTMPQMLSALQPLPSNFDLDDGFWDPRISQQSLVRGKMYLVNSYNTPFPAGYAVYYNKRVYNYNGITSPEDYLDKGQWTYENLRKCMEDAVGRGYKGGYIDPLLLPEQMGVSLINYDAATYRFTGATDNETFRQGFLLGLSLTGEELAATPSEFVAGNAGICVDSAERLLYNNLFKDMTTADIGVVPLPTSYQGQALSYAPTAYRGYGIGKLANYPEAAYYFLHYYLDLNKYEPAGAEIFANKVLEKFYRATHLELMREATPLYEHVRGALDSVGRGWPSSTWTPVKNATAAQLPTALADVKEYVDEAAGEYTALLKALA